MKRKLIILKLGGSVVTYKNRNDLWMRRSLLHNIAKTIKKVHKKNSLKLILIHGAGAVGHRLAKHYRLQDGTGTDQKKWHGALLSRIANQKLTTRISEILMQHNLPVTPVHTASVITNNNLRLHQFDTTSISTALNNNCIPLLNGDMVFDLTWGMSICSGDSIAAVLAKKFDAQSVLFASDIDGIYTTDPYRNTSAQFISSISFSTLFQDQSINLSGSHNTDATDGLKGKLSAFRYNKYSSLKEIVIFDGLEKGLYEKTLLGKPCHCSVIKM